MIVTLFFSRLRSDMSAAGYAEYEKDAERIAAEAESMPGYISHKFFTAEDGERLTVVQFETKENQEHWRQHAEHRAAQLRGREKYYGEYRIIVGETLRAHAWEHK